MKCPYCRQEMREGYIQGGQGVIFSENTKSAFIYKNPFNKKDISLSGPFMTASPAHYCDSCQCLIWKKSDQ